MSEAARLIGRGPRYVRRLVDTGQIRTVRVGRRVYVVWRSGLVWVDPATHVTPRPEPDTLTPAEARAQRRAWIASQ